MKNSLKLGIISLILSANCATTNPRNIDLETYLQETIESEIQSFDNYVLVGGKYNDKEEVRRLSYNFALGQAKVLCRYKKELTSGNFRNIPEQTKKYLLESIDKRTEIMNAPCEQILDEEYK